MICESASARGPARRLFARCLAACALALAGLLLSPATARAAVAEPAPREEEEFDFMNFLAHRGLHDLNNESWIAYGQVTDIWSLKLAFPAK
jgi:hypothetical protein